MTKQEYLHMCLDLYGTSPDYPFEDLLETAVLLPDAPKNVITFLTNVSFEATEAKKKARKKRGIQV